MESKVEDILAQVTEYYGITPVELFLRCRKRDIVFPRQVFFYLCCRYTKKSMDYIGRIPERYGINRYNHATVLHGRDTVTDIMETNRGVRMEVLKLEPIDYEKVSEHQKEIHLDHLERDNVFLRAQLAKGRKGVLSSCEQTLLEVFSQLSEERKANIMSKIKTELKVQQLTMV